MNDITDAAKLLGRKGGLKSKARGADYKALSKLAANARAKKKPAEKEDTNVDVH